MNRLALAVALTISVLLSACGGGGGSAGGDVTAQPIVVTSLADNGEGTLRQALLDTPIGGTITFDPALAGGTISLFSVLDIDHSVTIQGPEGASPIYLDGNSNVRHFYMAGGITFRIFNLHLLNGYSAVNSGSIFGGASGVFHAQNCTWSGNESGSHGGVMASLAADLTFIGCHFVTNQAEQGGALRLNECTALMNNCSFAFNVATGPIGGAISTAGGSLVVRNSTLHGNSALDSTIEADGGGAISLRSRLGAENAHLGLYGCTLTGNSGSDAGAGILGRNSVPGSMITVDMRQTIVAENMAFTDPDIMFFGPTTVTSAYCLVGIRDGAATVVDGVDGNIVGDAGTPADPMLDVLTPNWIGTVMRPALAGSPVRDVVPHVDMRNELGQPLAFDQRLFDRADDIAGDIGAVETSP